MGLSKNRELLQHIDEQIELLDEQQRALGSKASTLSSSKADIIIAILKEEKSLQDTEWELQVGSNNKVYVNYTGTRNDKVMKELSELCSRSWHDSFDLGEGVRLQFDDGDVSLSFDNSSGLTAFAKKNNLKIIGTNVTNDIRALKRQVEALELISHQFNLKG